MKICAKLFLVILLVLARFIPAASTTKSEMADFKKTREERRIEKDLCNSLTSWLSDANESAAIECDKLLDSLLSLKEPSVQAYFIAAQVASLREKPNKAIAILEDVISKDSNETAPIGMYVPVKIVGRLWIATIAKQSGDTAKAKNMYETILAMLQSGEKIEGLEDNGGLIMMCNLYLAEIESLHLKRNDLALARLEAIQQVRKPEGQLGAGYDIYKGWARYQHSMISKGKAQATQQLFWYPEMMSAYLLALDQITLSGIDGAPLAGSMKGMNIVTEILVNCTIKSKASVIDKNLAMLGYGFDQDHKRNFAEAEKHYSVLFQDDSFFSPVSGLYLANCKKAQDKTVEAEGILEKVKTKYPGYESAVIEIRESWKKEKKENLKND